MQDGAVGLPLDIRDTSLHAAQMQIVRPADTLTHLREHASVLVGLP